MLYPKGKVSLNVCLTKIIADPETEKLINLTVLVRLIVLVRIVFQQTSLKIILTFENNPRNILFSFISTRCILGSRV